MAESANGPLTVLPADPNTLSPEELAADAERTRRRLGRTISQLEQKLSPHNIAQKSLDRVRERALDAKQNAEQKAKEIQRGTATWTAENPLPALTLAFVAGFAWGFSR